MHRAGPAAKLAALLRDNGIDPRDVTRASGTTIDLETIAADDFHPLADMLNILGAAIRLTGDELLSLKLAMRYRWHDHGVLHRLGSAAPTLRQALIDFCDLQGLYSSASVAYFHRFGPDFALGYGLHTSQHETARHLYALAARLAVNYIDDLTGGAVRPAEVHLCFSPPGDVAAFQRYFDCPVRFDQSQCCVLIAARDIDHPNPAYDSCTRDRLRANLELRNGALGSMTFRVERLIRPQLLQEDPGMAGAARALGMHPRTLRRALAAEATTFEAVRDGVRDTMARELLDITQLGIGEISAILAYSSHSAFVRAFQRWNGMTPTAWRGRNAST